MWMNVFIYSAFLFGFLCVVCVWLIFCSLASVFIISTVYNACLWRVIGAGGCYLLCSVYVIIYFNSFACCAMYELACWAIGVVHCVMYVLCDMLCNVHSYSVRTDGMCVCYIYAVYAVRVLCGGCVGCVLCLSFYVRACLVLDAVLG